jgi:cobalt/nickel transport system permease protein
MARTCRSTSAEIARGAITIRWPLSVVALGCALLPRPAAAMHLADGILPAGWTVAWWSAAALLAAAALGRLRSRAGTDRIATPLTGTMAALVFVLSSLPIPVGVAGSTGHACGTGLAAIVIGPWLTFLASFVSLLLQAVVEGHGGLTALGANAVSMGLAGAVAGWGAFRVLRRAGVGLGTAAFAAGMAADVATYGATTLQLALALHGEHAVTTAAAGIGMAFLPVQLPIALLEGALTAGALRLLARRRPELLVRLGVLPSPEGA